MKKQLQHASSVIAQHYGLRWANRSLTFNRWKSVGLLSNLFFVSVCGEDDLFLYLIDRAELCVMDEGIRHKKPCFYFTPEMHAQLEHLQHALWYVSIDDELVYIKTRDLIKLYRCVNIQAGDSCRHRFDQETLLAEPEIKLPYIPGRGRVKRETWHRHLKRSRTPQPVLV